MPSPTKVANEFYMEAGVIRGGLFYPKGKTAGEPLPASPPKTPSGAPRSAAAWRAPPSAPPSTTRNNNTSPTSSTASAAANAKTSTPKSAKDIRSSRLCHLANLSYRLGSEVPFRRRPEAFGDDKAAGDAFEGMKEHLSKSARLKLDGATYRLGRKLQFDAAADRFVGDEEANGLLTRPYRPPFVVPEQV